MPTMSKATTRIWPALESIPGHAAVLAEWRLALRDEFDSFHRFLIVTRDLAQCLPTQDGNRQLEVVQLETSRFVGFDHQRREKFELAKAEILIYRFDMRRLLSELADLIDVRPAIESISKSSWLVGRLPSGFGSRVVVFSSSATPERLQSDVAVIANQIREPFLLLLSTPRQLTLNTEALAKLVGGVVLPVAQLVEFQTSHGRFALCNDGLKKLRTSCGTLNEAEPENQFLLSGEFRKITYAGLTIHLKESAGLWYLALLLGTPNRDLPAIEMASARSGVSPLASTGSLGEVVDRQALAEYKRRLDELDVDLLAATDHHDLGQVERLQLEKQRLLDSLKAATGLGGRIRKKSDADRSRKSVSAALTRDLDRIAKHHAVLGQHLANTISQGTQFRYAPQSPIEWHVA